jgi:Zn-dependent protease
MDSDWLFNLLITAPPLLLSLTIHEYAHARTALAFGDPTAKIMGRCTLNPLVHLDLLGTICLLFSHLIGWAKPVPVNPANLHPPRLGNIAVSLAGPASNLSLAIICGLVLKVMIPRMAHSDGLMNSNVVDIIFRMLEVTLLANIGLFAFNLIPLFPLDGHHILRETLPLNIQPSFMHWQVRFGPILLMAMVFLPRIVSNAVHKPVFDPIDILYNFTFRTVLSLLGMI